MSTGVIELLTEKIRELELDSLIIGKQANIRYLTGFTGEDSFAYIASKRAVLITDGRFSQQAAAKLSTNLTLSRPRSACA